MNNPNELKPEGKKFVNELMNPDQALKEVFKQNNLKRPKAGMAHHVPQHRNANTPEPTNNTSHSAVSRAAIPLLRLIRVFNVPRSMTGLNQSPSTRLFLAAFSASGPPTV